MELVEEKSLEDVCHICLNRREERWLRNSCIWKFVSLACDLTGSGSLYYCDDLPNRDSKIIISSPGSRRHFCIGPNTSLRFWYGKSLDLSVELYRWRVDGVFASWTDAVWSRRAISGLPGMRGGCPLHATMRRKNAREFESGHSRGGWNRGGANKNSRELNIWRLRRESVYVSNLF